MFIPDVYKRQLEMTVIFYARKLPAITKKCYLCIKKKELFESMRNIVILNLSLIHISSCICLYALIVIVIEYLEAGNTRVEIVA